MDEWGTTQSQVANSRPESRTVTQVKREPDHYVDVASGQRVLLLFSKWQILNCATFSNVTAELYFIIKCFGYDDDGIYTGRILSKQSESNHRRRHPRESLQDGAVLSKEEIPPDCGDPMCKLSFRRHNITRIWCTSLLTVIACMQRKLFGVICDVLYSYRDSLGIIVLPSKSIRQNRYSLKLELAGNFESLLGSEQKLNKTASPTRMIDEFGLW